MPRGCWFVAFVWFSATVVHLLMAAEEEFCPASKPCGDLNISRPFWLTDRGAARSCGPSDFEVTCNDTHTPILRSSLFTSGPSSGFKIVDISYEQGSLRVVDLYKLESLRTGSNGCQVSSWNTSVKLGDSFRISPVNLNLVLYNCTTSAAAVAARRDVELVEIVGCGKVGTSAFVGAGGWYDADGGFSGYYRQGCNATVVPVVGSSSGEAKPSEYQELIGYGFLLTLDRPPPPLPVAG